MYAVKTYKLYKQQRFIRLTCVGIKHKCSLSEWNIFNLRIQSLACQAFPGS